MPATTFFVCAMNPVVLLLQQCIKYMSPLRGFDIN